jgi:hypothetical protein
VAPGLEGSGCAGHGARGGDQRPDERAEGEAGADRERGRREEQERRRDECGGVQRRPGGPGAPRQVEEVHDPFAHRQQ